MNVKDLIPHVYSLAAKACKSMFRNKVRQAIVISGESGSGKTEAAKIAMRFLATTSNSSKQKQVKGSIEQRILDCNPVIEAFGNAKTSRNYNSSRFGKYIKLIFNVNQRRILGAVTKQYLLEKSRVTSIPITDRNFHIFYFLLKGAPDQLLQKLHLWKGNVKATKDDFEYLKIGKDDIPPEKLDDVTSFKELDDVLKKIGFTDDEQMDIYKIISAILHIGNMTIDPSTYNEQQIKPCSFKNPEEVKTTCELLGCNEKELEYELQYRGKVGDSQRSPCPINEATNQRDTLARTLYNNLFSWLIIKMNNIIIPDEDRGKAYNEIIVKGDPNKKTIGLLDIFGFEKFDENFYQQLLINYTNEKLQKLYLNAVFESEKKLFTDEDLKEIVSKLDYHDKTTPVLELLDNMQKGKPQGMFKKVDDYKKNSDINNLLAQVEKEFQKNPYCILDRNKKKISISHTAKQVQYNMENFIETNQDKMSDNLKGFMFGKMSPSICRILKEDENMSQGNTIWKKFDTQMKDLMDELAEERLTKGAQATCEDCELQFIRCVKPNEDKHPNKFIDTMVLLQITYMGVLDTIRILKTNYPHRRKYIDFYKVYEDLCSVSSEKQFKTLVAENADFKKLTEQLIKEQFNDFGVSSLFYCLGKTKIFMKNEMFAVVEEARVKCTAIKSTSAIYIQNCLRYFTARAQHNTLINKIIMLKKNIYVHYKRKQSRAMLQFLKKISMSKKHYKTEKRKEVEEKAIKVIASMLQTMKLKEEITKATKLRLSLKKAITRMTMMNKLNKITMGIKYTNLIFNKAWNEITAKSIQASALVIQSMTRGMIIRKKYSAITATTNKKK